MKTFTITIPILEVQGQQFWSVQAESKEEAMRKFEDEKASFVGDDIEVTRIGKPTAKEDTEPE